jgi:hypothetical protein
VLFKQRSSPPVGFQIVVFVQSFRYIIGVNISFPLHCVKENIIIENNTRTTTSTILSDKEGHRIELVHNADDPDVWIVRSSKTRIGFKSKTTTLWFPSEKQAVEFAQKEIAQHQTKQTHMAHREYHQKQRRG